MAVVLVSPLFVFDDNGIFLTPKDTKRPEPPRLRDSGLHWTTLGNKFFEWWEAGGIEPPSEKDSREASTGLGWVSYLASGLAPNQGVRRPVHRKVSRVARQTQRHASPIVLHLASLSA